MSKHVLVTSLLVLAVAAIGIFAMWPRTVDKAMVPSAPVAAPKRAPVLSEPVVYKQSEGYRYRVVTLRAPTPEELALIAKSDSKDYLKPGNKLKVTRLDRKDAPEPDLIVFVEGPEWCGSGGCASDIIRTKPDGGIDTYGNRCYGFGDSGMIGVGEPDGEGTRPFYSLDADGNLLKYLAQGELAGKPVVCFPPVLRNPITRK